MPRPKNPVPTYKHHKPTNTARCWVSGGWVSLGRWNSPASRQAHARILAALAAAPVPDAAPVRQAAPDLTLDEVLLAFWTHAQTHYRDPDGKPTSQVKEYRLTIRALRELYGAAPAAEFSPLKLKAVRDRMVAAGLARSEVNRRVSLARRVFKWAAAEELVPFDVYHRLTAVGGLEKGRSAAPETEPVGPVDPAHVAATLPHLNTQVRGLLEFMRLTGCRPGEAGRLRWCDVDRSGPVWWYTPHHHKNAHRGKGRVIAVGPRGQRFLLGLPAVGAGEYVFDPRRATAEHHAARRANRKTPRYPSQEKRNVGKRAGALKRAPGGRYTAEAVCHAVERAIGRANTARVAAGLDPIPGWSPNQLRHTHGTEVRARFGLEAAQVVLGHEKANTTEIYAEKNRALAALVAAEVG